MPVTCSYEDESRWHTVRDLPARELMLLDPRTNKVNDVWERAPETPTAKA